MKTAGMFIELGRVKQPDPQPSILTTVSPEPLPDTDRVVAYLRAGHDLIAMMDVQNDVFDSSQKVLSGSSIKTDGDWLWREDLAYYVSRHDVAIPEEFLQLIRQRRYIVPDVADDILDDAADQAEYLMF
jgi:hypothetical protein